jgi:hypothetical protein
VGGLLAAPKVIPSLAAVCDTESTSEDDEMLGRLVLAAVLCAPAVARADDKGQIDWARRVIKARGQGAPDLSAPSISVARLGAERAAKADAMRNLLELLQGATVESGASVGTLLQNDSALKTRVHGVLRGFTVVPAAPGKPNPHYYSDGGVAIDVELPIDSLPPELAKGLQAPAGVAPAGDARAEEDPTGFIIDTSGFASPGANPRLVDESGTELLGPSSFSDARLQELGFSSYAGIARTVEAARRDARLGKGPMVLKAFRVSAPDVVVSAADAARLKTFPSVVAGARIVFVIP